MYSLYVYRDITSSNLNFAIRSNYWCNQYNENSFQ